MKFKKMLALFTAAAMSISAFAGMAMSASAATEADLVPISGSGTYWFQDAMTAGLAAGDTIFGGAFYTPTGNSYASNKGKQEGGQLNCLRLKNVQNVLQFKVSKPAEITVYTQAHGSRGTVVTSTVPGGAYASYDAAVADTANVIAAQPASTSSFTFTIDSAKDLCLSSYAGDFYIAGVSVKIATTDPEISVSPVSETVNMGNTLTIVASTQNTGDAVVTWSSDNEAVATVADGVVTPVAPGNANIIATVNVGGTDYSATCAVTVQDVATVTFDAAESGAVGKAPAAVTVTKGNNVTIPENKTLYVDGSTLTGWTDGTKTYAIGESVVLTADVNLTPVFTENTVALGDADSSVTFNFGPQNGAPTITVQGSSNGYAFIVAQANVGGTAVDVKLDIDATSGKFYNEGRTDALAQVNGGTKFYVPVIKGAVVTVNDIYNDAGTYTMNGVEKTGDNGSETAAADGTIEIVAGTESGGYWSGITVAYPKKVVVPPVYTGKVALLDTFSGEGYDGEASAFTVVFDIAEDATYNTVTVAISDKSDTKDVTTVTGGSVKYGVVVNKVVAASEITATATLK